MSSKFSDMISHIKEVRQVEEGRQVELESGDMKALVLAAFEVFGPVLLGMLLFFGCVIWMLTMFWR